jgi:hypothetical protein
MRWDIAMDGATRDGLALVAEASPVEVSASRAWTNEPANESMISLVFAWDRRVLAPQRCSFDAACGRPRVEVHGGHN